MGQMFRFVRKKNGIFTDFQFLEFFSRYMIINFR